MEPIPLSPLQLKSHCFTLIHVRANSKGQENGKSALDQHVNINPLAGSDDEWNLELFLKISSVDAARPFFYDFELQIVGVVQLVADVPKAARKKIVAVNGFSLLYGALREMVLNLTARSIYGPFGIPTLNFAKVLEQATVVDEPAGYVRDAKPVEQK